MINSFMTQIRPDAILLKDMKIGQKFYEADYKDPLVYVLLDFFIDNNDPDKISWVAKIYKTSEIIKKTISGQGMRDRHYVFKYVRRDRSSYIAGFQACMRLYHDHMQSFDRHNAGLDNQFNTYNTMYDQYNKWIKNLK